MSGPAQMHTARRMARGLAAVALSLFWGVALAGLAGPALAQTPPDALPPLPAPPSQSQPSQPPLPPLPVQPQPGVPPGLPPRNASPARPDPMGTQIDEFRDIAPPVEISWWTPRRQALAAVALALLLTLFGVGLRNWLRRVRPPAPPPDPLRVALEALERLKGTEGSALSARDFAAAVASVLRRFLEAKHGLAAPRQTSEEFLATAESSNRFAPPVRERLRQFLRQCDELKFAKATTGEDGRGALLEFAGQLVREVLL